MFLLNWAPDPNEACHKGETPLHWASKMGHTHVVKMLLDGGARPEMRNKRGENPLIQARQHGRDDVFQVIYDFIHLKCSECAISGDDNLGQNIPSDRTFKLCTLL